MKPAIFLTLALAAAHCCTPASAAIVVAGTRVVYPAENRDVGVRVTNNGEIPALVQSWVDAGDTTVKPEELDVPFSISPSIYRLDPAKTQVMRLVYLGAALPKDRESVYWLNVLEIPPKPTGGAGENYLQFAIKSRLKIFFRPPGLSGSADAAPASLKWSVAEVKEGALQIKVDNPTAFHVSFAEVKVQTAEGSSLEPVNGMVSPRGTLQLSFKLPPNVRPTPVQVHFKSVNDYGAFVDGQAALR